MVKHSKERQLFFVSFLGRVLILDQLGTHKLRHWLAKFLLATEQIREMPDGSYDERQYLLGPTEALLPTMVTRWKAEQRSICFHITNLDICLPTAAAEWNPMAFSSMPNTGELSRKKNPLRLT